MYPLPYRFLISLVASGESTKHTPASQKDLRVTHPNESLFVVRLPQEEKQTLVLSQGFDPGWQAYNIKNHESRIMKQVSKMIPYFFGKRLEHVKINNWANGWLLADDTPSAMRDTQIVIIYLPQYLQYLGFALLLSTVGYVLFVSFRNRPQDHDT